MSGSDGTLTDSYGYGAFGNVLDSTGTGTQPYRFAGEHFDPDAQMQYHRARWYDPAVGRFASLDPFSGNPARPATLHKYAYAGDDPVNQVDPSGLMSLITFNVGLSGNFALNTIAIQGARLSVQRFLFNAGGNGLGVIGELIKRLAIESAQDLLLDSAFDALDAQGRGTRGHSYFEKKINELNGRIKKFKPLQGIEIQSEVFFDNSGQIASRRAKDSIGVDVLVLYKGKRALAFDLKFGRKMGGNFRKDLKNRLDMNTYDVGIFEVTIKIKGV